MLGNEVTEEQMYEDMEFLSGQTELLAVKLNAYVKENELEKLP